MTAGIAARWLTRLGTAAAGLPRCCRPGTPQLSRRAVAVWAPLQLNCCAVAGWAPLQLNCCAVVGRVPPLGTTAPVGHCCEPLRVVVTAAAHRSGRVTAAGRDALAAVAAAAMILRRGGIAELLGMPMRFFAAGCGFQGKSAALSKRGSVQRKVGRRRKRRPTFDRERICVFLHFIGRVRTPAKPGRSRALKKDVAIAARDSGF